MFGDWGLGLRVSGLGSRGYALTHLRFEGWGFGPWAFEPGVQKFLLRSDRLV